MVCETCGRASLDTSCSGCRTLERLRRLWVSKSNPKEDPIAISSLRNCAGELADLYEGGSATGSTAPAVAGSHPGTREVSQAPSGKEKKNKERDSGGGRSSPPKIVKEEPQAVPDGPVKEPEVAEEESEESSELAVDEAVPVEPNKKVVELTERERAERYRDHQESRGEGGGPLGLRVLPVKLSAPTQDGRHHETPQGSRTRHRDPGHLSSSRPHGETRDTPGGEARVSPREGRALRARSPDYPPPRREDRHRERRGRSRSPHGAKKKKKKSKGSKGIRKRERGKAWLEEQRSAPRDKPWRPRQG